MPKRQIIQVGIVVRDLYKSLKQYTEILDTGPWSIYTYAPPEMTNCTYRGEPSDWSSRVAFTRIGDTQLEIIQPLNTLNIYHEFLEKKGEGMHHIKEWVDDLQETIEQYRKKGVPMVQSGIFDGSEFYYFDTEPQLGIMLEITRRGGTKHRKPDDWYPPR
jgi:hypothetical protein